jgi:hypothetical protein
MDKRAGRHSRSLEEEMMFTFGAKSYFAKDDEDESVSRVGGSHFATQSLFEYNEDELLREFGSLTEYKKEINDDVQNYVSKIKHLEEIGFLKSIGMT